MIECCFFVLFGVVYYGWFDVKYYFLFVDYYDFCCMGWGVLCVWNDDIIVVGIGFLFYVYVNMEIIIYVREGVIIYQDNLGNQGCIEVGDVQVMSVGMGICYLEYNCELGQICIFQIWIMLDSCGLLLVWGVKLFLKVDCVGYFVVLVSGMLGDDDVLLICVVVWVFGVMLKVGQMVEYCLGSMCLGYLVFVMGMVDVDGVCLEVGDGVVIVEVDVICVMVFIDIEFVFVDIVF